MTRTLSLLLLCLCPEQRRSSTCWVSKSALSLPSPGLLLLLQMGQQPRGLHYKQQIKGLPLIRCQGQRGALPVLAMIQYLLICCAPGWKEISPLTGKIGKEGGGYETRERGKGLRGGGGGGIKEVEKSKHACGPLERTLSFSYEKRKGWG